MKGVFCWRSQWAFDSGKRITAAHFRESEKSLSISVECLRLLPYFCSSLSVSVSKTTWRTKSKLETHFVFFSLFLLPSIGVKDPKTLRVNPFPSWTVQFHCTLCSLLYVFLLAFDSIYFKLSLSRKRTHLFVIFQSTFSSFLEVFPLFQLQWWVSSRLSNRMSIEYRESQRNSETARSGIKSCKESDFKKLPRNDHHFHCSSSPWCQTQILWSTRLIKERRLFWVTRFPTVAEIVLYLSVWPKLKDPQCQSPCVGWLVFVTGFYCQFFFLG
jgi:hypothetical protein